MTFVEKTFERLRINGKKSKFVFPRQNEEVVKSLFSFQLAKDGQSSLNVFGDKMSEEISINLALSIKIK